MAFYPMALLPPQFSNPDNGENASGFILEAYVAGTTTTTDFYSDSAGTSIGSSITLDSAGFTSTSAGSPGNAFIPYLDDSVVYKFILTDPDTLIKFTVDDVYDVSNENSVVNIGKASNYVFETVATMATKTTVGGFTVTPVLGQKFTTLGRLSEGDGGGADFVVTNDTANGYDKIDLGSSFTATLQPGEHLNFLQIGGNPDGTTVNDSAMTAATALGRKIFLGDGSFRFNTTITLIEAGIVGNGPNSTNLIFSNAHAITIPSDMTSNRAATEVGNFTVNSQSNTCDSKYVIYAEGVASAALAVTNIGLHVHDIEVGTSSRFGGGIYLKDYFRANFERIGFTDVSRMIRLVGSVVQCKFKTITSNNDTAASALNQYGISTESALYDNGEGGTELRGPENVRFIDISYIRGKRGINHAYGLGIEFINFDTEADDYGALLNAPCNMKGGVIGVGIDATSWVGISRGVSIADADDATVIDGVDINCLREPGTPASSYGIDAGDGVSPVRGLSITNCRIRGVAGSLESAFRGRICNDITFNDNFIRTAVVNGTNDVSCTGATMFFERNRNSGGVWNISDSGDSNAYGTVDQNDIATLNRTFTTRNNWTCRINGAIISEVEKGVGGIADGGTAAHGLSAEPQFYIVGGSVAGEIITITSADSTNLTFAIKDNDGSAGTTQAVRFRTWF